MAGQQNVFFNSGVKMPRFTGVSQSSGQQHVGDIDLGDLFADYFVNELDPNESRNNYNHLLSIASAPVANPLLAPVPAAAPQAQSYVPSLTNPNENLGSMTQHTQNPVISNVSLPTRRGIKTAFHSGGLPNLQGSYQVVGDVLLQQQQQQQQQQIQEKAQQASGQSYVHVTKKLKPDQINQQNVQINAPVPAGLPLAQTNQPVATNTTQTNFGNNATTGSGISGRLGFSMVGGQLAVPNRGVKPTTSGQRTAVPDNSNQAKSTVTDSSGSISLPVGVGIRIGGQTGAVHQSHQDGKGQSSNWGGNVGVWSAAGLLGVEQGRGGLSEQVIAERRQRNREHAKRSRVRKKFLLESLQEQVRALQKENSSLRMFVYENIPQHAQKIISECCKASPLFSDDQNRKNEGGIDKKEVELVKSDFSLIESLSSGQQNFVLSDPRLPDNPIVFASDGFYKLTGYTREQVLGRNCRFLQGPQTDGQALEVIRTAIANGTDATACLLNYKADGTPFWNQFFIAALRDADNNIVNYVGVQCAVEPEAGTSALEDKVNSVMPLQEKDEGGGATNSEEKTN